MREQNKSCIRIGEEIFSRGSKGNNKEYTVLEGSAGRKTISNKNEAKQFKNGKQLTVKTATPSYKPTQFLPEGLAIRDTQTNKFRR